MSGSAISCLLSALQELETEPQTGTLLIFGVAVFGTVALMLVFGRRRSRRGQADS